MLARVVVINDDGAGRGGAAAIAVTGALLIAKRGIPVTFLSGDGSADPALSALGVEVVPLAGIHIMNGRRGVAALRGLSNHNTQVALQDWLAIHDNPGTIYHLHNWHKVLSPSIFTPLHTVASRLVMTAHDYFLACPNGGYFLYPQGRECNLAPGGLRCLVTSCDRRHYGHKLWRYTRHQVRRSRFSLTATAATVLAVHEGMVPYLRRADIPQDAISVLRNPVTPWHSERVPAERNRDVLFVGRLERDKGIDLLAHAAQRAGVRLRIIGDGPLGPSLAEKHPEAELLGWRTPAEIAELTSTARMIVIPTRWRETFGLVALEALMSGIPVLASRFCLISSEIAQRRIGLVCDPFDADEMVGAIRRLADDDNLVREISQRAFMFARELAPSPDEWCDDLIRGYERKLASETPWPINWALTVGSSDGSVAADLGPLGPQSDLRETAL